MHYVLSIVAVFLITVGLSQSAFSGSVDEFQRRSTELYDGIDRMEEWLSAGVECGATLLSHEICLRDDEGRRVIHLTPMTLGRKYRVTLIHSDLKQTRKSGFFQAARYKLTESGEKKVKDMKRKMRRHLSRYK